MYRLRSLNNHAFLSVLLTLATCAPALANDGIVRVAVLSNSPPMSYTDAAGQPAGFNVGIAQALCAAMKVRCQLIVVPLQRVIPAVAAGEFDFSAVSLLDTPERRAKVLFTKAYYRSNSVWFAKPSVEPGAAGARVAAVAGSAQFRYAAAQGWSTTSVRHHSELPALLMAGKVDAVLLPMATSLTLRQDPGIQSLGLATTIMRQAELSGDVSFAVDPAKPELRERIDQAFDRIKRDGSFDRLNSEYFPFRLQ